MSTEEQRQRLLAYYAENKRISDAWRQRGYSNPPPEFPAFPADLVGLTCGAKTRNGTPCKQKATYINGRCKLHGGL